MGANVSPTVVTGTLSTIAGRALRGFPVKDSRLRRELLNSPADVVVEFDRTYRARRFRNNRIRTLETCVHL